MPSFCIYTVFTVYNYSKSQFNSLLKQYLEYRKKQGVKDAPSVEDKDVENANTF